MGRTARFTRGSRWDDLQVIGEALEFSLAATTPGAQCVRGMEVLRAPNNALKTAG